jgi:hypothetical protein
LCSKHICRKATACFSAAGARKHNILICPTEESETATALRNAPQPTVRKGALTFVKRCFRLPQWRELA